MTKRRAAVVASVCAGLLGALAACNAVLGITDFTAGDGGPSRDGSGKDVVTSGDGTTGDDSGDAGGLTCETQDGGAGAVGCPCAIGATGCNGYAQTERLVCTGGTWTPFGSCTTAGTHCDTRPGNGQGSCVAVNTDCADAAPGQSVCIGSNVIQCGPDLVSETPVTSCTSACVDGVCTGTCAPSTTQCAGGGVQTCSAIGQWSATSACSELCSDGGCASFPSCQAGGPGADTSCGPAGDAGAGTTDCCSSYEVPGNGSSPFYRSYDMVSPGDMSTNAPATVAGFRLDAFEITVGRFRNFVNAVVNDHWLPAPGSGKHTHLNGGSGLTGVGADAAASEPGWIVPAVVLPASPSQASVQTATWRSVRIKSSDSCGVRTAVGSSRIRMSAFR